MSALPQSSRAAVLRVPQPRLDLAQKWGAHHTVNIEEVSNAEERKKLILDLTDGRGPDVVVECAGQSTAFKDGLEIVRRGGRFLVIGQTDPTPISIVPSMINLRNIDIIGVAAATVAHFYKAL